VDTCVGEGISNGYSVVGLEVKSTGEPNDDRGAAGLFAVVSALVSMVMVGLDTQY
jgi:hypothetical protein